jgi:thiol-disulfide isomerase/thioredoxin
MDKKVISIIALFLVVIAAAVAYLAFDTPSTDTSYAPSTERQSTTRPSPADTPDQATPPDSPAKAQYIEYAADTFRTDQGQKVLFFHADWCPQCRAIDADIKQNIESLKGVTIYKVNYDSEIELRKQYGVTLQTTLVKTDGAGKAVDTFVAYDTPSLQSARDNLQL